MGGYSLLQWVFFFYIYCIVGWIWETSYCSVKEKHLINRGFMKGPVIPIYGSGAVVMLIAATPFKGNYFLTFLSGMILASTLEYCTGAAMEAIFKVRYWDYSSQPLNLNGHICIGASIGWGFATILMTSYLHQPIEKLSYMMPTKYMQLFVTLFTLFFGMDFSISVKAAIDLRNMLIKLDALKHEAALMQKRMDVLLAVMDEEKQIYSDKLHSKVSDLVISMEERLSQAKGKLDIPDEVKDELAEMRAKLGVMKERASQIVSVKDILRKITIKGNPNMVSTKFKDSLEELKNSINK